MSTKREVLEAAARGEGCLGRAADDEPVFVLRAQDLLADEVVEDWAYRAQLNGCPADKYEGATEIARRMRVWSVRRLPD